MANCSSIIFICYSQKNIQMQALKTQTLPPGLQQPIQGQLTIVLNSISFTSKIVTPTIAYRIKFWGHSQSQYSLFCPFNKQLRVQYNLCCSKDVLSQYLFDHQTLLIEVLDSRNGRGVGIVPVSLKRFSTLDNMGRPKIDGFSDRFLIFDLKKSKIGEVNVTLGIDYNIVKIQPVSKIPQSKFQRIQQISQPYTNRTENQIVQLIGTRPHNAYLQKQTNPLQQKVYQSPVYQNSPEHRPVHKKPKPQYIIAPFENIAIVKTNIELQTLKLKNDQHLFLKQQQSTADNQNSSRCPIEYNFKITNIKVKCRVAKPLQKLTIVYPEGTDQCSYRTTIINPIKVQNNNYYFGQEITLKLEKTDQTTLQKLTISIYFGEGFFQSSFEKLVEKKNQQVMTLRKKDNTKHSELTIRIVSKAEKEQFKLHISLGKYSIYDRKTYFFKLNIKSQPKSTVIHPFSADVVGFDATFSSDHDEICFIELWRKEANQQLIVGCLQLNIKIGSLYQKMVLQSIRKQSIGWIEVFWCLNTEDKLQQMIQTFKNRVVENRSKQNLIQNLAILNNHKNQNNTKKQLDDFYQVQNIPAQSPSPNYLNHNFLTNEPNEMILKECKSSHSDIYIKLLNNWRLSNNPQYKLISDRLTEIETLSKIQLSSWFNLLISTPQSQKIISIFPQGFKFSWLINSYYIYFQYLSIFRNTLQHLLSKITANCSKGILNNLSDAVVYFGYIDNNTILNIFDKSGVSVELTENIIFFLTNEDQQMILKSVLIDAVKNKNIAGLVPNGRILSYLIRSTGVQLDKQWDMSQMTHFEFIILEDNDPYELPKIKQENQLSEEAILSQKTNQNNIQNHNQHHLEKTFQPKTQGPLVQILIHSLQSQIADLTDIIINNKIYLAHKELPKKIRVSDNQELTVRVHSKEGIILEGSTIILGQTRDKKVKLYVKGKELGQLYLGEQDNQVIVEFQKVREIQQKIVPVKIQKKEYPIQPPIFNLSNIPLKIQILEISPAGYYHVQIQSSSMKFPEQYSVSLTTESPKLKLSVSNEDVSINCAINIIEGVEKYALTKKDGSVFCIVQLKIFPNYLKQLKATYQRRLFLVLTKLRRFANTSETPLVYILIEYNNTFLKTNQFKIQSEIQAIDFSTEIQESQIYSMKLFNRHNKLLCRFQFQIGFQHEQGMKRYHNTLAADEFRLELIVYQINLQKNLEIRQDKVENIMKLFTVQSIKNIQKLLDLKNIRQILRDDYHYTLSQINIIQTLISSQSPMEIFKLVNEKPLIQASHTPKEIYEQFSVYDFHHDGYVNKDKAELVCKLLGLELDLEQFIPQKNTHLVDFGNKNKKGVDYYRLIAKLFPDENVFFTKPSKEVLFYQNNRTGFCKVQLKGFDDLLFRQRPPSVCFQIQGKFIAQPVLRCSSKEYREYPQMVVEMPTNVRVFNKQYHKDSLGTYNLIGQSPLVEIIQIMGGRVYFNILKLEGKQLQDAILDSQARKRSFKGHAEVRKQVIIDSNGQEESMIPVVPSELQQRTPAQLQQTRKHNLTDHLTNQQIQEARRINTILQTSVDLSRFKFQSSDEES